MRALGRLLFLAGLTAIVTASGEAEATDCVITCDIRICSPGGPLLEGTVIDRDEETITFRVDRIHGASDDAPIAEGDTFTTYRVVGSESTGGLFSLAYWEYMEEPFFLLPIDSGDVLCSYPEQRVPLSTAIDLALADDCFSAAEEVLGPVPECGGDPSIWGCASGPGEGDLLIIALTATVFVTVRRNWFRRAPPSTPGGDE